MNKKYQKNSIIIVAVFSVLMISHNVKAAEITFSPVSNNQANNSSVIEVNIDPQSKNINVVEGSINLSGLIADNVAVKINTDDSILTLWASAPQYDQANKTITFTGGLPNGFTKSGQIFRIFLSSDKIGDISVKWADGTAYLNDGKGTKDAISSKPVVVNVGSTKNVEEISTSSRFNILKNVILVLIFLVALFSILKYAHKKIYK